MRTAQRKPITTGSRSEHVISTGSAPISERANSSTAYTYPANCAVIDCDSAVCVGGAKITLVSSFTSSVHTAFCAVQTSSSVPDGHTSHAKRPAASSARTPSSLSPQRPLPAIGTHSLRSPAGLTPFQAQAQLHTRLHFQVVSLRQSG